MKSRCTDSSATEDELEDAFLAYTPTFRKKIEDGLKDIKLGCTMPLSEYIKTRAKRK